MKRIVVFAMMLPLLAATAFAQKVAPKRYGWDNMGNIPLYGDVYSVDCVQGHLDSNTGQFTADNDGCCNYTYYFNEQGGVSRVIYQIVDGDRLYNVVGDYEDDSNGRVVKEPRIIGPLNENYCELIGECYHQYDSNGKKILTIVRKPDGEMAAIVSYSYDSSGRLNGSIVNDSQGNLLYKFDEYKYDEKGRLIEEPFYDRTGENEVVLGTNKYKYDYSGRIIERIRSGIWYYHSGEGGCGFSNTYTYKYDSEGFVVEEGEFSTKSYRINHDRTIIHKLGAWPTIEYRIEYRNGGWQR